jgi:hypothetical protein
LTALPTFAYNLLIRRQLRRYCNAW